MVNLKKISTFSIITLILAGGIGSFYYMNLRVLEGNYQFDNDYIIPAYISIQMKHGKFSFLTPDLAIIVYGKLLGTNVTIQGTIKVFESGEVNIQNSPHTVYEIEAYNSSRIKIQNSVVQKIRVFDEAQVEIDGDLYSTEDPTGLLIYSDMRLLIEDLNIIMIKIQSDILVMKSNSINSSEEIMNLENQIASLNYSIANLEENFDVLQNQILTINSSLTEKIDNLDLALAALDARVRALEAYQLPSFDSPPASPNEGQLYFNSITHIAYLFSNGSWVSITNPIRQIKTKVVDSQWESTSYATMLNSSIFALNITVQNHADMKMEFYSSGKSNDNSYYTYSIALWVRNSTWSKKTAQQIGQTQSSGGNGYIEIGISLAGISKDLEGGTYEIFVQLYAESTTGIYVGVTDDPTVDGVWDPVISTLLVTEYIPGTFM